MIRIIQWGIEPGTTLAAGGLTEHEGGQHG